MRKIVLAAAAALAFQTAASSAFAAEEVKPMEHHWTFDGILGKFDKQQLQRGFQVYKEVCASCHSLNYISFRNLADIGYSEDQVKVIAAELISQVKKSVTIDWTLRESARAKIKVMVKRIPNKRPCTRA